MHEAGAARAAVTLQLGALGTGAAVRLPHQGIRLEPEQTRGHWVIEVRPGAAPSVGVERLDTMVTAGWGLSPALTTGCLVALVLLLLIWWSY